MILVANKVDLMHLRKITRDQGKEMATKYNVGGHACTRVRVGRRAVCESPYAIPPAVPVFGDRTKASCWAPLRGHRMHCWGILYETSRENTLCSYQRLRVEV